VDAEYENLGKPSSPWTISAVFARLTACTGSPEYHWVSGWRRRRDRSGRGSRPASGWRSPRSGLANRYNKPGTTFSTTASIRSAAMAASWKRGVRSGVSGPRTSARQSLLDLRQQPHQRSKATPTSLLPKTSPPVSAYGWHVLRVGDANDVGRIERASGRSSRPRGARH